jgi:hypothetical protein
LACHKAFRLCLFIIWTCLSGVLPAQTPVRRAWLDETCAATLTGGDEKLRNIVIKRLIKQGLDPAVDDTGTEAALWVRKGTEVEAIMWLSLYADNDGLILSDFWYRGAPITVARKAWMEKGGRIGPSAPNGRRTGGTGGRNRRSPTDCATLRPDGSCRVCAWSRANLRAFLPLNPNPSPSHLCDLCVKSGTNFKRPIPNHG